MFKFGKASKKGKANKKVTAASRTIVIKGWPEVLIFLFMAIFILQLVLLIVLNSQSN